MGINSKYPTTKFAWTITLLCFIVSSCLAFSFCGLMHFFSPSLLLEIIFNVVCSDRDRQRRMIRFIRRTNRRKITKWWDTNRPTRIYNRHCNDILTSTPNHCPLYLLFVLLLFICPVHSDVSCRIQFIRLASHPNIVNKIATNLSLRSVKINLVHSHILPLTAVVQARCVSLHLTITNRHRQFKTRIMVITYHFQVRHYCQSPLLFYGRCVLKTRFLNAKTFLANKEHLGSPSMR